MKNILFLFLLIPFTLYAQNTPVRQENRQIFVNDTTQLGGYYFIQNTDSIWIEKPLGTFKQRLDYIQSSGSLSLPVSLGDGYFQLTENAGSTYFRWSKAGIKMGASSEDYLTVDGTGINTFVPVQLNGDSSLTTNNSAVTKSQLKREIAAADEWKATANGIRYSGTNGDSTVIQDNGTLILFHNGDTSIIMHQPEPGYPTVRLKSEFGDVNLNEAFDETTDGSIFVSPTRIRIYESQGNEVQVFPRGIVISRNDAVTYRVDSSGVVSFKGTFAGIYVSDGSTAQSIPTGTTYTKLTGFVTNGESSNCSADVVNDKITITKIGRYFVSWSESLTTGTNLVTVYTTPFLGGVEQASSHAARKIGTASDLGAMAGSGFINVTSVPVDLDLRSRTDNAGSIDITPVYMNLTVQYVGN